MLPGLEGIENYADLCQFVRTNTDERVAASIRLMAADFLTAHQSVLLGLLHILQDSPDRLSKVGVEVLRFPFLTYKALGAKVGAEIEITASQVVCAPLGGLAIKIPGNPKLLPMSTLHG